MKDKIKKVAKWIGLTFIVPVIVTSLVALIEKINIISAAGVIIKFIYKLIYSILTFKISILFLIIIFAILIIIVNILNTVFHKKESKEPEWKKYVEDDYEGLRYTWHYEKYEDKYSVEDLHPICKCGCELEYKSSYKNMHRYNGYLVCPMCGNGYENNFNEKEEAMQKRVEFKVKKMMREENTKNINK